MEIVNKNEYGSILFYLLSYKSSDVVLHTYSVLNDTVKKLINNFHSNSNKIDSLIANLLTTDVLNEIICFGCVNPNEKVFVYIVYIIFIHNYNKYIFILLCIDNSVSNRYHGTVTKK